MAVSCCARTASPPPPLELRSSAVPFTTTPAALGSPSLTHLDHGTDIRCILTGTHLALTRSYAASDVRLVSADQRTGHEAYHSFGGNSCLTKVDISQQWHGRNWIPGAVGDIPLAGSVGARCRHVELDYDILRSRIGRHRDDALDLSNLLFDHPLALHSKSGGVMLMCSCCTL
jgi:hypothetical protein